MSVHKQHFPMSSQAESERYHGNFLAQSNLFKRTGWNPGSVEIYRKFSQTSAGP